ncbi:DUF3800 domain-containing protein [Clostridium cochlearium]|uniref:DUF3800 domain-containing protein n=1 Tax=Clostridium cochlearium TaxID=1494 RepID=UPI00156E7DBD|nr:DUF3800 domain-containing protein [Clostridium cochlearium]MBV1821201.1 DUF3800 domain-containing protein [Bacteroidales bacterium MSK.15.36]MCG4572880.1 DUF3800 domain-containing protein [Clostridium cochlearium]MCG4581208.1 DUF3800 domain-containing protein [Clostridium cochlearium]NSJ92388.1 DUF3800 domain-containing protein [Coprococcus sp. MSK.21.13]
MSFEIYFDESHKLDKFTSDYSYYGVIGWEDNIRKQLDEFMIKNEIFEELHFVRFKLDKVENYLKTLRFALDKIDANFYIVNTNEALKIGNRIGIDENMLRKLFYIKIPERLIYGITRQLEDYTNINIYIDKSDEYGGNCDNNLCDDKYIDKIIDIIKKNKENKYNLIRENTNRLLNHIQLPKTLKFQLNAQSIYRGLKYSINTIEQICSNDSKSLQIADVLLGIIGFLFEEQYLYMNEIIDEADMDKILKSNILNLEEKEFIKSYYKYEATKKSKGKYKFITKKDTFKKKERLKEINKKTKLYSQKRIQKCEFIYRLLSDRNTLERFYNLNVFLWSNEEEQCLKSLKKSNEKEVTRAFLSRYIAQFFQFKTEFDNKNKLKILNFYKKECIEKKM